MRGIRQTGTKSEIIVGEELRRRGIHYRKNAKRLPGAPDFSNVSKGWAIFVHGCFWHRHEGCPKSTTPKRNREFWVAKFDANVRRDERRTEELRERGLDVLVVWECETEERESLRAKLEHFFQRNGNRDS